MNLGASMFKQEKFIQQTGSSLASWTAHKHSNRQEVSREIKLKSTESRLNLNSTELIKICKFDPSIQLKDNFPEDSKLDENWNSSTKLKRKKNT